jgi:hypothetical protein
MTDPQAVPVTSASRRRDGYDQMDVLSRSMLPIAIALATGIFSLFQWRTEQSRLAATRMSDSVEAVSKQRLAVSQLVQTFVPSLTSERANNRVLALQAIAYVDTALGNQLATALAADSNPQVRAAAVTVRLASEFPFLPHVEQVFGASSPGRIAATRALLANRGWLADTVMTSALLETARRDSANADGLFNTITILESIPPEVQRAKKDEILAFAHRVPPSMQRVRARADALAATVARR